MGEKVRGVRYECVFAIITVARGRVTLIYMVISNIVKDEEQFRILTQVNSIKINKKNDR